MIVWDRSAVIWGDVPGKTIWDKTKVIWRNRSKFICWHWYLHDETHSLLGKVFTNQLTSLHA